MMEVKNVCKSFKGEAVLKDVSFRVNDGETVLISGPSGRGKTTLLRLMMGLEKADSGEIAGGRQKAAAVFQEDRLPLDFTAVKCVKMTAPKSVSKETVAEHLSELGLSEHMDKPVKELSGGMKRRVCVCRAVLSEHDILFMDEPFNGLDSETKLKTVGYIKRHETGKTIVLVSHSAEDAGLLDARTVTLPEL